MQRILISGNEGTSSYLKPEEALISLLQFIRDNGGGAKVICNTSHAIELSSINDEHGIWIGTDPDPLPPVFWLLVKSKEGGRDFDHLESDYMLEAFTEIMEQLGSSGFWDGLLFHEMVLLASCYLKGLKLSLKKAAIHELVVRIALKKEGGSLNQVAAMLITASEEEDPALAILTLLDVPFGQPAMA